MPRTLALDVGDRRIGIAITDPLGLTAQPLFTLHREGNGKRVSREELKSVARFVRQHQVEAVVVGLPLNADGTRGPQAEKARAFAAALAEHLDDAVTVSMVDERLTTHEAHALLDSSAYRSKMGDKAERLSREEIIDQLAAMLLLEAWMEQQNGPMLLPDPDAVG